MKSANILSISELTDSNLLENYFKYLNISMKEHEIQTLKRFCDNVGKIENLAEYFDHFFISYVIPQISKEFDLLRISKNGIINIEMKQDASIAKIQKQLAQNKYYLSYLKKPLYLIAYIEKENKLYLLDEGEHVVDIDFSTLLSLLEQQEDFFCGDLDILFDPSIFLVSPFNSTEQFINDQYFLTSQQEEICRELLSFIKNETGKRIFSIKGNPGTGKTLLLYHFAKILLKEHVEFSIVHVGNLNCGQQFLRDEYSWPIYAVKETCKLVYEIQKNKDKSKISVIILDEAQRISEYQFEMILKILDSCKVKAVIGFDPRQTLSDFEKESGVVDKLKTFSFKICELTKKIRTNKKISSFVRALFDLKSFDGTHAENVSVVHFFQDKDAKDYISHKRNYKFITYTPSLYNPNHIYSFQDDVPEAETSHQVIGQEFDNVIVIIDSLFYYDDNGVLSCCTRYGNPYDQVKMLFQAVTRVRGNLEIVVVNNPKVFNEILNLLNR